VVTVRIAELADRVGVPTSTVLYYERVGLLDCPARTTSGYRDYGSDDAGRLLFVTRARTMGLNCDQIADLLPIWAGTNCAAAHKRVATLVEEKKADIAERIAELKAFASQLNEVRAALDAEPPPPACRTDLSFCVPDTAGASEYRSISCDDDVAMTNRFEKTGEPHGCEREQGNGRGGLRSLWPR
jgi:DNA-binding transcriptional MerR regulator